MVVLKGSIAKEQVEQWVEALRSGRYKQKQGHLYRDGGYCCLGVLAKDVLGYEDDSLAKVRNGTNPAYKEICFLLGDYDNKTKYTTKLMVMNDIQGKSFIEIADFIEERML